MQFEERGLSRYREMCQEIVKLVINIYPVEKHPFRTSVLFLLEAQISHIC